MAVAQEGSFGAQLRKLREAAGPTQEELALKAGLSPTAVSALERGQRKRPYPHTVRALADALNLSDDERAALIDAAPKRAGMAFTQAVGREDPTHTLLAPPTALIGRERDTAAVRSLLESGDTRLLTLTGPAGWVRHGSPLRWLGTSNSATVALYNLAQKSLSRGDPARAATLFEEAVIISEQVRDRAALAYCLEGLAVVANARGEAERCARLIGAAEGLHEAVGIPVYVYYELHRSPYESTVAAIRSQMGEEAFEAARADGRAMTFEQAVEYSLESNAASAT